jgi:hypothetical protein
MMHVMVVMVMMMDVVMMMVMVHRRFCVHRGCSGGRAGSCFLRDGVSGEAKGEDGRGRKGLDHGRTFPVV